MNKQAHSYICLSSVQACSYLSMMHTHASLPEVASARMRASAPCRPILDRYPSFRQRRWFTALHLVLIRKLISFPFLSVRAHLLDSSLLAYGGGSRQSANQMCLLEEGRNRSGRPRYGPILTRLDRFKWARPRQDFASHQPPACLYIYFASFLSPDSYDWPVPVHGTFAMLPSTHHPRRNFCARKRRPPKEGEDAIMPYKIP
jgi:hypothetical protein